MRKCLVFAVVLTVAGAVRASWYWPFGSDESADEKEPPRLSELMEPASLLIDEASDLAADGKKDESVEKYRKALAELDRIEQENPDRAKSTEFASLRNKRAYVNAAIDSMLLAQVQENAKSVAVSDTTELEKKLAEERWLEHMKKADEAVVQKKMVAADAEFKEAFGCYTNVFARASVYNAMTRGCFLLGDFASAGLTFGKAESCLLGYKAGDPFIEQALDYSLLGIRNVLADYRKIVETSKVVSAEVAADTNCTLNLDFIGRKLSQYDFKAANALYEKERALYVAVTNSATTNFQEKAEAEAAFLARKRTFDDAANEFAKLSPAVEKFWNRLARMEFPVLKEHVTQDIAKAQELKAASELKAALERKAEPKKEIKPDMTFTNRIVKALVALSRFESDHFEYGESAELIDLRNACVHMLPKKAGEVPKKTDRPKAKEQGKPTQGSDQSSKVSNPQVAKAASKREQAMVDIANGDYAAAEIVIKEMLSAKPNGAMALNLKATMESRQGKFKEAERTLDQAIRSNPRSHFAYYNMAILMLQVNPDNKDVPRRYYETGRSVGGPKDAQLEALIK